MGGCREALGSVRAGRAGFAPCRRFRRVTSDRGEASRTGLCEQAAWGNSGVTLNRGLGGEWGLPRKDTLPVGDWAKPTTPGRTKENGGVRATRLLAPK